MYICRCVEVLSYLFGMDAELRATHMLDQHFTTKPLFAVSNKEQGVLLAKLLRLKPRKRVCKDSFIPPKSSLRFQD